MLKDKTITVVIPCKNEGKTITKTVKSVPAYVDEIIVVDNGSSDDTGEKASKAGARVIYEPRKLNGIGYGYAHITGMACAMGDYIIAMDGDGTYPAKSIKYIINQMEKEHYDFVSCNRLPLKNTKAISKTRRLGINILNLEVLVLYGKPIQDILTGMWVMKKELVTKLNLKMGDWNLSPEIKISAMTNKDVRFAEYWIDHFERGKDGSKQVIWKTGFNHLFYILKRRFTQDSKLYAYFKALKGKFSVRYS